MAETVAGSGARGALSNSEGRAPRLKTLAAFQSPAFRLLWLNTLSFALVQGIQRFAFVWLVIDELGKPAGWGGLMTFALGVPSIFLMLPAGVLSDRMDRRTLLIATQIASTVVILAAIVLMLADLMDPSLALLVAVGVGSASVMGTPIRTAVLPLVVERDKLMNAIVLSTVGQNIMMIGGPIFGGAAIRLWGIEAGFGIQAVAYGVGLLTLLPLRMPPSATRIPRRPLAELLEGFEFVLKHREIKALVFTLAASGLFMLGPVFALIPGIVRDEMGKDAFAVSILFGIMGAGMVLTSLVIASIGDFGHKGAWFIANLAVGGIDVMLMGMTQSYELMALLMLIWGMGGGIFINLNRTLIQSHTPDELMGRVMSIQSLGMMGFMPLGGLLAGVLSGPLGATAFMILAGATLTVVSAATLLSQPGLRQMA